MAQSFLVYLYAEALAREEIHNSRSILNSRMGLRIGDRVTLPPSQNDEMLR